MKVKTTVHIYYQQFIWEQSAQYICMYAKLEDSECQTYIGEQVIEIEVPDDYDPRAQKVAALEKQKQRLLAEFQKTVDQINERISKLQALEYTNAAQ